MDRISSEGLGRGVFAITFVASPISAGVRGEQVINAQILCHGRALPRGTTWLACYQMGEEGFLTTVDAVQNRLFLLFGEDP